jgi:hypothetical protein
MTTEDNGRQVSRIMWEGQEMLTAGGQRTLRFSATHHGDHDEFWVEEYFDAVQIAIHNCRYIVSITWAQ